MFSLAIILVLSLNNYFASSEVVIACEGTTLNISCSTSSIVHIIDANYGRTSLTECPKPGLDSNVHCTENVTEKVSQRCNSRSSCSINASNDDFKDPCKGTYKALQVNFTCTLNLGPGPVVFPDCGKNEQRGCVNPCNKKCQTWSIRRACPTICEIGCVCKPGYIRDTLSGMCVGDKYCPLPGSPCDTHEQYSECDAAYQPTCTDPKRKCVGEKCVPGYICDKRYLRDSATGKCVLPSHCTKKPKS